MNVSESRMFRFVKTDCQDWIDAVSGNRERKLVFTKALGLGE